MATPVFSGSTNEFLEFLFNQCRGNDVVEKSPAVGMDNESNISAFETTQLSFDGCCIELSEGTIIVLEILCSPTDSRYTAVFWNEVRTTCVISKYCDSTQKVLDIRPFDY